MGSAQRKAPPNPYSSTAEFWKSTKQPVWKCIRTPLLYWEKAFDKVGRESVITVLRRMGVPEDLLSSIASLQSIAIIVTDGKQRSSKKGQRTGIRQGRPLSPYIFFTLLSAIMKDLENNLSEEEENHRMYTGFRKAALTKSFYADSTLVMTTYNGSCTSVTYYVHPIRREPTHYNSNRSQSKCCLLRTNALEIIQLRRWATSAYC